MAGRGQETGAIARPADPVAPFRVGYPGRPAVRRILCTLSGLAFFALTRLRIEGQENIPGEGPVILVANHFHFGDPAAIVRCSPRPMEFVGGFRFPFAPRVVHFIPHLWGYIPAYRGGYSRSTLRRALAALGDGKTLALFPEGGAWADVLRPGRPGAAFLALNSQAQVVPIGIDGITHVFRKWRPQVTIQIGKPIGPFRARPGATPRQSQGAVTEQIMRAIAALIPPERRGVWSEDPAIREAAREVAENPFEKDGLRGL